MTKSNAQRVDRRDGGIQVNRARHDISVRALSRVAEGANPEVVSRILASAVVEQFTRERSGINETMLARTAQYAPGGESGSVPAAKLEAAEENFQIEEASVRPNIPLWKRVFDCSAIFLTAPLWLPVMLLIMLGIKLSSPGPVFYRQARIGFRGRHFMIFKFRTMKVNVETVVHESYFERLIETDVPMTKLDSNGDPRLISCGRFLRAAGLDELPQLFNVLRGDMSLVGPRPCTTYEFDRYLPYQKERVNAPPGLTGYWQVNGKNRTTFSEMIAMDIFYAKNMSLALDLLILGKTLPAIAAEVFESRRIARWKPELSATHISAQATKV